MNILNGQIANLYIQDTETEIEVFKLGSNLFTLAIDCTKTYKAGDIFLVKGELARTVIFKRPVKVQICFRDTPSCPILFKDPETHEVIAWIRLTRDKASFDVFNRWNERNEINLIKESLLD